MQAFSDSDQGFLNLLLNWHQSECDAVIALLIGWLVQRR